MEDVDSPFSDSLSDIISFQKDLGNIQNKHKFAYAFLIAGIDPSSPKLNYRGYIYSVAVSAYLFKVIYQSNNDIIVMIRMHANTNHTELPPFDANILHKSGIIVKYLPKPEIDNFHTAMMDKFRILDFDEYSRVMYLDADVIPLNNLDYIFDLSVMPFHEYNISGIKELEELSDELKSYKYPIFQENVGLGYNNEPTNGGLFMMKPNKTDYQALLRIVERREREGYHFNETLGWGHVMREDDPWECLRGTMSSKWDFYGSFTDQGLIYYWMKYVRKHVTLINGKTIKTWVPNITAPSNPTPQLIYNIPTIQFFDNQYPLVPKKHPMNVDPNHKSRAFIHNLEMYPPYRDFHHFKEKFKPWINNRYTNLNRALHELWFDILNRANKELNLGLIGNITKLEFGKPDLGMFPAHKMVEDMKNLREKKDMQSLRTNL